MGKNLKKEKKKEGEMKGDGRWGGVEKMERETVGNIQMVLKEVKAIGKEG